MLLNIRIISALQAKGETTMSAIDPCVNCTKECDCSCSIYRAAGKVDVPNRFPSTDEDEEDEEEDG